MTTRRYSLNLVENFINVDVPDPNSRFLLAISTIPNARDSFSSGSDAVVPYRSNSPGARKANSS
jgi:hypothetical protein